MLHGHGHPELTLTHWSGPTLLTVTVISGLSSRTLSLEHLGSSLVQMLMGTIQLGHSSPGRHEEPMRRCHSFRSGAHARATLTVMWTAGAELLLRNLDYAIVTLLKATSGSEFALTQRKTPADVLNEAHLFLVHDDDGESHLLGPRAHHCCNGFPTGLFQTVPKIL